MSNYPIRKPNRLKSFDYSQNAAYFITICTKNRRALLGVVEDAAIGVPHVKLSACGEITKQYIESIPTATPDVFVSNFVIMPNHIHLILVVGNITDNGTPRAASPTKAVIPKIINSLKGLSSKKARFSLWQRSFHDHIIRNETEYIRIADYIENNPAAWEHDCHFISFEGNKEET